MTGLFAKGGRVFFLGGGKIDFKFSTLMFSRLQGKPTCPSHSGNHVMTHDMDPFHNFGDSQIKLNHFLRAKASFEYGSLQNQTLGITGDCQEVLSGGT